MIVIFCKYHTTDIWSCVSKAQGQFWNWTSTLQWCLPYPLWWFFQTILGSSYQDPGTCDWSGVVWAMRVLQKLSTVRRNMEEHQIITLLYIGININLKKSLSPKPYHFTMCFWFTVLVGPKLRDQHTCNIDQIPELNNFRLLIRFMLQLPMAPAPW